MFSRKSILLLTLAFVACVPYVSAGRIDLYNNPLDYSIWFRQRELPVIPYTFDRDQISNEAEGLALLSNHSELWKHIRETQNKLIWFVGTIEPNINYSTFLWSHDQVIEFVLSDTTKVDCVEVIASHGSVISPFNKGDIIEIYPSGANLAYDNILLIYPDDKEVHTIYAAFPRGKWKGSDVWGMYIKFGTYPN